MANARQVPSFYSDTEEDAVYLHRYKLRKVVDPTLQPTLSESPFMVETERYDMSVPEDPEHYKAETLTKVALCTAKPRDIEHGVTLLRMSEAVGVIPDTQCYHFIAGLMLQAACHAQFVAWYDELRSERRAVAKSPPMLYGLLCACVNGDHIARALNTTKALLDVSDTYKRPLLFPQLDSVVNTFTARASGSQEGHAVIVSLFANLPTMLVQVLIQNKLYPMAQRVVEHLHRHKMDIPWDAANTLFRILVDEASDAVGAFRLFHALKGMDGAAYDASTLNKVVVAVAETDTDGARLFEVAQYMRDREVRFDATTVAAVFATCERTGDAAMAGEFFTVFRAQDVLASDLWGAYIGLVSRTKPAGLAEALQLYHERRAEHGLSAQDSVLYRALYAACFASPDIMRAVELLEDIAQSGCPVAPHLISLYDFCCSEEAAEYMQELSLTPSADGHDNQTELDRLLARALAVDAVAFEAFAAHFKCDKEAQRARCLHCYFDDHRDFFGQRDGDFSTIFCEATVRRMCKGRSFILLFDSSALVRLADVQVQADLELLMGEGQARSQAKSVILVTFQTQVQLMKMAAVEGSAAPTALRVLGEWYRGKGDWLKFLGFSNFVECVMRFSDTVAGTTGDATSERLALLSWLESFAEFHKSVILVTEDADTRRQAVEKKTVGIDIRTLLQAVSTPSTTS